MTSRIRHIQLSRLSWLLPLAGCLLSDYTFAWQHQGPGARTLYIELFKTKVGAEKFRQELTAELRKLNPISIVSNESNADLILGGGGEIWTRGYRSFSPRSHMKLPTNGTPIYGGYLSVELRDKTGDTLWSYLATPETGSGDISKDLSRRIAKHLSEDLSQVELPMAPARSSQSAVSLRGAGATFPYPVYQKWFTNFSMGEPGIQITYDAIGSEAGVRRLLAGGVDFAASDSPEAIHELAPGDESKYLFFPSVIGAVVPIVNLPGLPEDVAFTQQALAGIFLGKITKWNDPIIQAANRGLHLPDLDIVVVHRGDGSGTSYAWTSFLSKTSPEWKAAVGASLTPKWPTGRAATGNDGVGKLVKELGGSIGYVEYIYALQNHLNYGKVGNQNGDFVEAGLESLAASVAHVAETPDDLRLSIVNAPGPGAYPIASLTWLVTPAHIADDARRNAITEFLRWMIGPGQRQAAALGYLTLPKEITSKEVDAIAKIN